MVGVSSDHLPEKSQHDNQEGEQRRKWKKDGGGNRDDLVVLQDSIFAPRESG